MRYLSAEYSPSCTQHKSIQLEEVPFEDLNEDQRRKVERKEDVLEEISRLTKRVRKEDFMYVHARGWKGGKRGVK